jgi:hypothetical protein
VGLPIGRIGSAEELAELVAFVGQSESGLYDPARPSPSMEAAVVRYFDIAALKRRKTCARSASYAAVLHYPEDLQFTPRHRPGRVPFSSALIPEKSNVPEPAVFGGNR